MSNEKTNPNSWTTEITDIHPNRVAVRGYDIAQPLGHGSFGAAVSLTLPRGLPADTTWASAAALALVTW